MVPAFEANLAAFLGVAVLGLGLLLTGVSALSWRRVGHRRLLFVTLGFAVLALQGAWASWRALAAQPVDLADEAFAFALLLLLYASVAVRGERADRAASR